jgi:hypothetical protein
VSRKIGDLTVKVGEYQKDGQTKGKYENVGALMEGDDGRQFLLLKRTFNPAGVPGTGDRDSIIVSIFQNDGQGQNQGGGSGYGGGQQRQQSGGYGAGGYQIQNAGGYGGNQRQQGPPQGQQNMNYGGGGNYQNQAKDGFKDDDPYDDQIPF